MNKFSKPLVVFTAAAAFAFLGFTAVSKVGGPNWQFEAEQLSPTYTIEEVESETGSTWKVTDNVTKQAVSNPKPEVHASAVIAARKHLDAAQKKEIADLNAKTADAKAKLEAAVNLRGTDEKAMEARFQELSAKLDEVNKQILDARAETVRKSQEAQAIRAEGERRRGDVFRLERELQEIQADLFQAVEHQKYLRDQLERLNGMVGPLERRHQQLEEALN